MARPAPKLPPLRLPRHKRYRTSCPALQIRKLPPSRRKGKAPEPPIPPARFRIKPPPSSTTLSLYIIRSQSFIASQPHRRLHLFFSFTTSHPTITAQHHHAKSISHLRKHALFLCVELTDLLQLVQRKSQHFHCCDILASASAMAMYSTSDTTYFSAMALK